ncbi:hypothetical protein BCV70DRAFT_220475, partial [Testicularia cyperi]
MLLHSFIAAPPLNGQLGIADTFDVRLDPMATRPYCLLVCLQGFFACSLGYLGRLGFLPMPVRPPACWPVGRTAICIRTTPSASASRYPSAILACLVCLACSLASATKHLYASFCTSLADWPTGRFQTTTRVFCFSSRILSSLRSQSRTPTYSLHC